MAYAVTVKSGYSKFTVRFPTAEEALAKGRDEIAHDADEVVIVVAATGDAYSVNGFAEQIKAKGQSSPS